MSLTEKHKHPRDDRIRFDEAEHLYFVDDEVPTRYISVTTFIKRFAHEFDAEECLDKYYDKWQESKDPRYFGMTREEIAHKWKNNPASRLGTLMHADIERYLNGEIVENDSREFQHFLEYQRTHGGLMQPFRAEWRVWHEDILLAGSMDMTYLLDKVLVDGVWKVELAIYDWKRSKEIKNHGFGGQKMRWPLQHLDDCNHEHYNLQLNLYRRILQDKYDVIVNIMYLVVFHPKNIAHYKVRVPIMDKEIDAMIAVRKRELNPKMGKELVHDWYYHGELLMRINMDMVPAICGISATETPQDAYVQALAIMDREMSFVPDMCDAERQRLATNYTSLLGSQVIAGNYWVHRKYPSFFGCDPHGQIIAEDKPVGFLLTKNVAGPLSPDSVPKEEMAKAQYLMWISHFRMVDYWGTNGTDVVCMRVHGSVEFFRWMKQCLFYFIGCLSESIGEDGTLEFKPPDPEFYKRLSQPPFWSINYRNLISEMYDMCF